ncbi:helix-turn-helix transcriptional regulator [Actinomadura graeca]|uniref:Helix-turn-helix transcriptional regulator n=1 Tax=Actinomadura graeca TaxID=2750812 RepID=A0ABX8QPE9_9ACTN|nr:helix-turn-helix transcriptional regulator [Actinomadura graeca]QXJ20669.1 helix-turn-helix transcriptional regulator [Actinomadura graeca]
MRGFSEAAKSGASTDELAGALSRAVAPAVAHDAVVLAGTSPAMGPGRLSFSFWHGFEIAFGRGLLHNHYAGHDPFPLEVLARRRLPVAVLGSGHRDGRQERAAADLMLRHGVGCELRVLLRDTRGVWGVLGLLRSQGGRPFDEADVLRAVRLTPDLVAVMREYVTAGPLTAADPAPLPGVIIVGSDHTIRAATAQAVRWEKDLRPRSDVPDWCGESLLAGLAMRARGRPGDCDADVPQFVGPSAAYGRWVACHAQPLSGDGAGDVAIVVQSATTGQRLPSFCDWYGITARERQIIVQLCDAAAPKQIARRLGLSAYTVNDHLKSIYRKTGACGRGELLAAIANP